MDTVTYWTVPRPGGVLYGEANGVLMSKDVGVVGEREIVILKAYGVGRLKSTGGARFHGSVYYRTGSTGKRIS